MSDALEHDDSSAEQFRAGTVLEQYSSQATNLYRAVPDNLKSGHYKSRRPALGLTDTLPAGCLPKSFVYSYVCVHHGGNLA
jgi:hypothetical protein